MWFFVPNGLVEFEYFDTGSKEVKEEAKEYQDDIDFAFFVVNFHYSRKEYEELTPRQKLFIYKAYENKVMSDIGNMYHSCFTAMYNVQRPKNKRALKLFRKTKTTKQSSIQERVDVFDALTTQNDEAWLRVIQSLRK